MRPGFIFVALIILFLGCQKKSKDTATPDGNPSGIHTLEGSDAEMNKAVEAARSSLSEFEQAIRSNNAHYELFALKVMFPDEVGGFEHLWITDIFLEDQQYHGFVGNEPQYTLAVEVGQEVTIDPEEISDWMYVESGTLRGGYTLRVLRNRLSPEERAEFDRGLGFTIAD